MHNNCRNKLCTNLQIIILSLYQLGVVHPEQLCRKHLPYVKLHIPDHDASPGNINLRIKLHSNRLPCICTVYLFCHTVNGFYLCRSLVWQNCNFIPNVYLANLNLSLKSPECTVWTAYTLNWKYKSFLACLVCYINFFQIRQQRLPMVPEHFL